jgi:hypothetical protein
MQLGRLYKGPDQICWAASLKEIGGDRAGQRDHSVSSFSRDLAVYPSAANVNH